MTLALEALGIISLLELLLWLPPLWRWRNILAGMLVISLAVPSGFLAGEHFTFWALTLLFFSLYRMINLLRVIEGRTQADYLFRVARRSSLWLIGWQLAVLGLASVNHVERLGTVGWLYGLAVAQLALAAVLLSSTWRHLGTTRPPTLVKNYTDRDLPTLSVAIPARNENEDLEACLQSLSLSTYPKLEILVLDDCSQDKHTAEIIRSFAQKGVRFIAGQPPPDNWLAKNYAYKQLADVANGTLLLFCGVDTRFAPNSLRVMVETLLQKQKSMLSILPCNTMPGRASLEALLVQPGRYAWELALPRRLLNRPPVLSTYWLITAATLHAAGGLSAVAQSNSPESYFARYAISEQDGYSFLQSDTTMELISIKPFPQQRATAVRTRYPQLHRRPELVGLLSLVELVALVLPFALAIGSLIGRRWLLAAISSVTCGLLITLYVRIVALTYRRFLLRGLWLLPFAVLYDIGLLNYSMWRYEFREVIWKGRNVCLPIMGVVANLSKLTTSKK